MAPIFTRTVDCVESCDTCCGSGGMDRRLLLPLLDVSVLRRVNNFDEQRRQ